MYNENDTLIAKSALKRFIVIYSIIAALMLGGIVTFIVLRMEWPLYTLVMLLTLLSVFLWGNIGVRLVSYHRFLKDVNRGLEKEAIGIVASIDAEEAVKEGIEFRGLHLIVGDETDKIGGRLLYIDSSKFPIKASVGQKVRCKLFGYYVKDLEILEDE